MESANEQALIDRLRQLRLGDHPLIQALRQARASHEGQLRDDGSSYLEQHVYPVTLSVIDYFSSGGRDLRPELVAAALLHDTLEDDNTLTQEIFEQTFGPQVYGLVGPLTKESSDDYPGDSKAERRRARSKVYHAALQDAPLEAKIIKVLDRLNNIRWLHTSPDPNKPPRYIAETEEFYLPFARSVSVELADRLRQALDEARSKCGLTHGQAHG